MLANAGVSVMELTFWIHLHFIEHLCCALAGVFTRQPFLGRAAELCLFVDMFD